MVRSESGRAKKSAKNRIQTNPLKEDPVLGSLLKKLDKVQSKDDFDSWTDSFLSRFVLFLDEKQTLKAEKFYGSFSHTMSSLIQVINKLNDFVDQGLLSPEKCTVKSRQCLQEFSQQFTVVVQQVDLLVPSTVALEQACGYTKFHMGAVLVRDGFREYGRMSMAADVCKYLETKLVDVADKIVLLNMKYYYLKLQMLCDVMADLGMFQAMLKSSEFVSADTDEDAIDMQATKLDPMSAYPEFNTEEARFESSIVQNEPEVVYETWTPNSSALLLLGFEEGENPAASSSVGALTFPTFECPSDENGEMVVWQSQDIVNPGSGPESDQAMKAVEREPAPYSYSKGHSSSHRNNPPMQEANKQVRTSTDGKNAFVSSDRDPAPYSSSAPHKEDSLNAVSNRNPAPYASSKSTSGKEAVGKDASASNDRNPAPYSSSAPHKKDSPNPVSDRNPAPYSSAKSPSEKEAVGKNASACSGRSPAQYSSSAPNKKESDRNPAPYSSATSPNGEEALDKDALASSDRDPAPYSSSAPQKKGSPNALSDRNPAPYSSAKSPSGKEALGKDASSSSDRSPAPYSSLAPHKKDSPNAVSDRNPAPYSSAKSPSGKEALGKDASASSDRSPAPYTSSTPHKMDATKNVSDRNPAPYSSVKAPPGKEGPDKDGSASSDRVPAPYSSSARSQEVSAAASRDREPALYSSKSKKSSGKAAPTPPTTPFPSSSSQSTPRNSERAPYASSTTQCTSSATAPTDRDAAMYENHGNSSKMLSDREPAPYSSINASQNQPPKRTVGRVRWDPKKYYNRKNTKSGKDNGPDEQKQPPAEKDSSKTQADSNKKNLLQRLLKRPETEKGDVPEGSASDRSSSPKETGAPESASKERRSIFKTNPKDVGAPQLPSKAKRSVEGSNKNVRAPESNSKERRSIFKTSPKDVGTPPSPSKASRNEKERNEVAEALEAPSKERRSIFKTSPKDVEAPQSPTKETRSVKESYEDVGALEALSIEKSSTFKTNQEDIGPPQQLPSNSKARRNVKASLGDFFKRAKYRLSKTVDKQRKRKTRNQKLANEQAEGQTPSSENASSSQESSLVSYSQNDLLQIEEANDSWNDDDVSVSSTLVSETDELPAEAMKQGENIHIHASAKDTRNDDLSDSSALASDTDEHPAEANKQVAGENIHSRDVADISSTQPSNRSLKPNDDTPMRNAGAGTIDRLLLNGCENKQLSLRSGVDNVNLPLTVYSAKDDTPPDQDSLKMATNVPVDPGQSEVWVDDVSASSTMDSCMDEPIVETSIREQEADVGKGTDKEALLSDSATDKDHVVDNVNSKSVIEATLRNALVETEPVGLNVSRSSTNSRKMSNSSVVSSKEEKPKKKKLVSSNPKNEVLLSDSVYEKDYPIDKVDSKSVNEATFGNALLDTEPVELNKSCSSMKKRIMSNSSVVPSKEDKPKKEKLVSSQSEASPDLSRPSENLTKNAANSNEEKSKPKEKKAPRVISEEVRWKCYMWYARLGQPTRDVMKARVVKLGGMCDVTPEDVDALPWICNGQMIRPSDLSKLILNPEIAAVMKTKS